MLASEPAIMAIARRMAYLIRMRCALDFSGLSWPPILLLVFAGCGGGPVAPEPPVKTYPVLGKVVYKGGAGNIERLERATVWFLSKTDPTVQAIGRISDDGSFQMALMQEGKTFAGVPAGTYKVRLEPPVDEDRNPQENVLAARYTDFDTSGLTVTVPTDGEITLEVERPRR